MANPKSIAFFGASNNRMVMGSMLLKAVQAFQFEGPIYPIHPKETEVDGLKAYRSVLDLPEVPDLAVLVLPTGVVAQVLDECGRKGIKQAIIISAGFKEIGEQGANLEKELLQVANKYGISFLGPNCIGLTNTHKKLNTAFFEYEGEPGFIGMASQSGSFINQMFSYLGKMGLGFSTAFSVGNEAMVDIVDCMKYLGDCPHTRVIGLYIEGIRRGREFVEVARAISPHKPIVALYVGGSETGRRAGFSHTGSMAGPDRLYDGIFQQSGVIRARSVTELFDFCWVLGSSPPPKGSRLIIQTQSGGPGAAAADSCGREGLEMPPLSPETIEKLSPFIPHTGSMNNPVDITFTKRPLDFFADIPEVLLSEKNADILLVYFLMESKYVNETLQSMGVQEDRVNAERRKLFESLSRSVAVMLEKHGKPIVGYTFCGFEDEFIQTVIAQGIPVLQGHERAARAISALVKYRRIRERMLSLDKVFEEKLELFN
ncbi:acetate--CoA ligase family protein [Thermodesulfobacteriota bacterium]